MRSSADRTIITRKCVLEVLGGWVFLGQYQNKPTNTSREENQDHSVSDWYSVCNINEFRSLLWKTTYKLLKSCAEGSYWRANIQPGFLVAGPLEVHVQNLSIDWECSGCKWHYLLFEGTSYHQLPPTAPVSQKSDPACGLAAERDFSSPKTPWFRWSNMAECNSLKAY